MIPSPPHTPFFNFGVLDAVLPIPLAARCKAWICDPSFAGTAVSNPIGNMDFCFSVVR